MRRDGFNEVVSFSLHKRATRTLSVKQRLTLHRKAVGNNSMPLARQDGLSTYVQVCQLISIWLRLICLNPSRAVLRVDPGIHGTIEPVRWSSTNDVSVLECIPLQQPSVRGAPTNREPKWRQGKICNQGITYKARVLW